MNVNDYIIMLYTALHLVAGVDGLSKINYTRLIQLNTESQEILSSSERILDSAYYSIDE